MSNASAPPAPSQAAQQRNPDGSATQEESAKAKALREESEAQRRAKARRAIEGEFVEPNYPTPNEMDVVEFMEHKPKPRSTK